MDERIKWLEQFEVVWERLQNLYGPRLWTEDSASFAIFLRDNGYSVAEAAMKIHNMAIPLRVLE